MGRGRAISNRFRAGALRAKCGRVRSCRGSVSEQSATGGGAKDGGGPPNPRSERSEGKGGERKVDFPGGAQSTFKEKACQSQR